MHPEHVQTQRRGGVEAAQPHQGGHSGDAELPGEPPQRIRGVGVHHPAAGIDERAAALPQHLEELAALLLAEPARVQGIEATPVSGDGQASLPAEGTRPVLHVLGHIHHHRAGTAGARDLEGRAHGRLELFRPGHQKDVLGDRAHDRGDRGLLKGVGADRGCGHLAADHHDGYRVGHAVPHRGHGVGGAGARGHQNAPHFPAGARIPGRHEAGALLVGGHDQRHGLDAVDGVFLVVAEDRVVGGQDRPSAVTEDCIDAFIGQNLNDHVGPAHDPA